MKSNVLVVDNDSASLEKIQQLLSQEYELIATCFGHAVIGLLDEFDADLIIINADHLDVDPFSLCREIESLGERYTKQIILISENDTPDFRIQGYHSGGDDFLKKPFVAEELLAKVAVHTRIQTLIRRAISAENKLISYTNELERLVDARTSSIQATQDMAVFALAKLADSRDPETGEHLVRMRYYSQRLAIELSKQGPYKSLIDEEFLNSLYRSSPLHDIGKVGIADHILLKPGKLTDEEFKIMQQHTVIGAQTLAEAASCSASGNFFEMATEIAMSHHERWDGTGYPEKIKSDEIPVAARIVSVADVFDALTSKRVYKKAFSPTKAYEMIVSETGKQFDPTVVKAFQNCFEHFEEICENGLRNEQGVLTDLRQSYNEESTSNNALHRRWQAGDEQQIESKAEGQRVLVVDDDPAMLQIVAKWLERAGYKADLATNGQEAIEKILHRCPKFVLTDWKMPGISGKELCQWIRKQPLPHYVYTIMMTASNRDEDITTALRAGADDFVRKPLHEDELSGRLRAASRVVALEQQLNRIERKDPLTGISTFRMIEDALEREWRRSSRYELPLSCALVDIDGFKEINQKYDHDVGDAVLQKVAKTINENIRMTDYLCRYSGDQFLVFLGETNECQATSWAERIRKAFSSIKIAIGDETINATASIGIAQKMSDTKSVEMIVDLANEALCVAKQIGENSCVHYGILGGRNKHNSLHNVESPVFASTTAADVMNSPIFTLNMNETTGNAIKFLLRLRLNSVPIVDDDGNLVGIISERDLISNVNDAQYWQQPVHLSMTRDVVVFKENTPIQEVSSFLSRAFIRRVVIINDAGAPVGVLSRGSMLSWFNEKMQQPTTTTTTNSTDIAAKLADIDLSEDGHQKMIGLLNEIGSDISFGINGPSSTNLVEPVASTTSNE